MIFTESDFLNLRTVSVYGDETKLCISDSDGRLYTVRSADISRKAFFARLAGIQMRNAACVRYIAERDGKIYVVSDYIPGTPLAEILRDRVLDESTATDIALDICSALCPLHAAGLVHRDINPNNIVIDPSGHAVLIDFGISREYSTDRACDTVIMGTPGYAAPEQFGFTQSDARTDIYALGVLLNVMITGYMPGEHIAEGRIGGIIGKCTDIAASGRFPDASSLSSALSACKNRLPLSDRYFRCLPGIGSDNRIVSALCCMLVPVFAFCSVCFFIAIKDAGIRALLLSVFWFLMFPLPYGILTAKRAAGLRNPSAPLQLYNRSALLSIVLSLIFLIADALVRGTR